MRLYLIKRVSDGKFFVNINGHWMLANPNVDGTYWSDKPQTFLKTPEGVAGNLRKLCSEPYYDTEAPEGICPRVAVGWKELSWKNFEESQLEAYEVVCMDVDVISMTATPALEFIQVEAIANRPLSRKERAKL